MRLIFKKLIVIVTSLFGVLVLLIAGWNLFSVMPALAQTTGKASSFKGKIIAVSDADMLATAYANGILNKVKGIEDSLSIIEIGGDGEPVVVGRNHVSNSVVSWPSVIANSTNRKIAYVAETRGIYKKETQKVKDVWKDLPTGSIITVLDISNSSSPGILQEKIVGENIQGVSVNHDNTLLAAGSSEKGKEIVIATLDSNGVISNTFYFTDDDIKEVKTSDDGVKTIEFHPSENIIAVNFNNKLLAFFEVYALGGRVTIKKSGSSLAVARNWSVGNWLPNGRYFILSNVNWGEGAMGAILNGKGNLVSVAFDKAGSHKIVSTAKVGLSPEGFDISPDGNYAVVSNMRRTYGPKNFWFVPGRKHASLSLVKVNAETGELKTVGKEYAFEGALPEDAIFDEESNSIAVAVYHKLDEMQPVQGWIEFWELENDQLIRTGRKAMVTRGVHNLKLLK